MLCFNTTALMTSLLLFCSGIIHSSLAFLPVSTSNSNHHHHHYPAVGMGRMTTPTTFALFAIDNNNKDDPTKVWYAGLANTIQNVLTNNSPLNNAKIALVKNLAGDYDATAIRTQLNDYITKKPVVMLSFQTCPFCIKAKSILNNKNAKYHVVELDIDPNGKAIRAEMANLIGRTSVPAIFINGNFIGGCNDGGPNGNGLVQLDKSGELDIMLRAVNAI